MNEKRGAERQVIVRKCWISAQPGAPLIQALVQDISKTGAKIKLGPGEPVADRFRLNLTIDGKVARWCTVRWREGEFIGAQFDTSTEAFDVPRRNYAVKY